MSEGRSLRITEPIVLGIEVSNEFLCDDDCSYNGRNVCFLFKKKLHNFDIGEGNERICGYVRCKKCLKYDTSFEKYPLSEWAKKMLKLVKKEKKP